MQLPYDEFYYRTLPWFPIRKIPGTNMHEINVFFFCWLGGVIQPIYFIQPGQPLAASLQQLALARVALEGFKDGEPLERAFPRAAVSADELMAAINDIVPPVGSPVPNLGSPIQPWQIDRLKALCNGLSATLKDEAQRAYIIKVEDQRSLSSHALVEEIEKCFPKDAWDTIGKDAKRELEEAGKCLALERYTAAGFHSLRGVECVIRQYITKLTGHEPDKRKRDWGFYVKTLADNGADPKLIAVLDNIRSLERNPLMHPEDSLDIDEAVGVFNICQTAIVRLVAGIKK